MRETGKLDPHEAANSEPVDIDELTGLLSLQNFRAARGGLYRALRELRELRAEVRDYRTSINFGTSCTNCAQLLDKLYRAEAELEKADLW